MQINESVDRMTSMLHTVLGEKVQFESDLGEGLPNLFADPNQMAQIVLELCLNARKSIEKDGRVSLSTRYVRLEKPIESAFGALKPGEYIRLQVSDNGEGIPAKNLPHIFEPFFTTRLKDKGSGLGLSVIYGIVRQHGGLIDVESEPGAGSTFTIYIPIDTSAVRTKNAPGRTPVPDAPRATILIAEDDDESRDVLRRLLESAGHRVLLAEDGDEAVRIVERHQGAIELSILDVVMPKMEGDEVHAKISALRPEMKFLFVTGYAPPRVEKALRRSGAWFVSKPFHMERMSETVSKLLLGEPVAPEFGKKLGPEKKA